MGGIALFRRRAQSLAWMRVCKCVKVADALDFVVGKFHAEMIFEAREEFECLQAVNPQFFVEIVAGLKVRARKFEMRGSEDSRYSVGRLLRSLFHDRSHFTRRRSRGCCGGFCRTATLGCPLPLSAGFKPDSQEWLSHKTVHGKYGCGPAFSTNLRRPSMTAGRVKSSQKMSISRRSSSAGNGLMKLFAAAAVVRSNFVVCVAVARATRRDSPSAATWLTRPTESPFVALMLRPVSNRSRTTPLPMSRFNRGIPPKPGISPSRNSGKQKARHFVRDDQIARERHLESPPKQTP